MAYYDFRLNEQIEAYNGDIIQEIGDPQNARDIIYAGPGNFFAYPLVGVGIQSQINAEYQLIERQRNIRAQLKRDGFVITYYADFLDTDGDYQHDIRAEK